MTVFNPASAWHDLCERRHQRAAAIAPAHLASAEVLHFAAGIARLQQTLPPDIVTAWPLLRNFLASRGPALLREHALQITESHLLEACVTLQQRDGLPWPDPEPTLLVARILLQPKLASTEAPSVSGLSTRCPRCGGQPQCGSLTPLAFGRELSLVCSLCLRQWKFRRGICPQCSEADESRLAFFKEKALPHVEMQACDTCRHYLHLIDLGQDKSAVPDIDELLALPVDLWAAQQGYRKIVPNLAGL